jgi:hypothetical protein
VGNFSNPLQDRSLLCLIFNGIADFLGRRAVFEFPRGLINAIRQFADGIANMLCACALIRAGEKIACAKYGDDDDSDQYRLAIRLFHEVFP